MQSTLIQDISYAIRQLRKTPGFTITAVLTLALGIGANAAIFTLVNAVLLKNLPVVDPATLVRFGDTNDCCVNGGAQGDDHPNYSLFPTATYNYIKKNAPEFQDLAAMQAGFVYRPIVTRRDGTQETARSVMGEFVSGNYFRTFGLQPAAGRLFTDADDVTGAPMVAVMSYETWQQHYAGDPSVVGSTFWVNTKPVTIVGIAPRGYFGDRLSSAPPDFYLPIESMPVLSNAAYVDNPNGSRWLYIVGRLKPGAAMTPQLQEKMSALMRQAFAQTETFSSEQNKKRLAKAHVVLTPGGAGIRTCRKTTNPTCTCSCGSPASSFSSPAPTSPTSCSSAEWPAAPRCPSAPHSAPSAQESSANSSPKASSSPSSAVLAGLIVAYAGTRMLLAMAFPGAQNVPIEASPSAAVLAFAFGLSLLTGILFGVAPAWITANANPADALRTGSRTTASGASLLQRGLVVLQAALSLVLLVGAGMFIRSLNKLQHIDLKLDSTNRYIVHVNPQAAGYSATQLESLYRTIEARFHAIPGVKNVGLSHLHPHGRQQLGRTASRYRASPTSTPAPPTSWSTPNTSTP